MRRLDPEDVDFSMRTPQAPSWPVVFSTTESLFYSILILSSIASGAVLMGMSRSADVAPSCCQVPW